MNNKIKQVSTMDYRTQNQLEEIAENALNGNWRDAARGAFDGGFYHQDFIDMGAEKLFADGWEDIALLLQLMGTMK